MTVTLNPILQRLAERRPIPVMAHGILEHCLNPAQLDAWFASVAEQQYTRTLLFSAVFDLMTPVVPRQQPSVNAAWQVAVATIGVSVTSVYNKLNGLEPATIAGLVSFSSTHVRELIRELGETRPPLWPGIPVKGLDHRLKETWGSTAAPLPGQSLVVFDPQSEVITTLFPEPDAYTQERALLGRVLETVQAGESPLGNTYSQRGWSRPLANAATRVPGAACGVAPDGQPPAGAMCAGGTSVCRGGGSVGCSPVSAAIGSWATSPQTASAKTTTPINGALARAGTGLTAERDYPSQPSHQQQHEDDDHHQAQHTAGRIAPAPAVRPGRNGTEQHQDQNDQQYGSQAHELLLEVGVSVMALI
jgi:hypothetical protein